MEVEGGVIQIPGPASVKGPLESYVAGTRWMLNVLEATQAHPPKFGCFGLHEWAMLYKVGEQRHTQVPLRISNAVLEKTVDEIGLRCSHFDAFRFFTPDASPLNPTQLARETMVKHEQPGCLHANMDVYRWAFKRAPWVPADLILDAFELAMDIRTLDMASSPYDVRAWGIEPVRVEDRDGRAEFIRQQEAFSTRAHLLREQLIGVYQDLLDRLEVLHNSFAIAEAAS